LIESDPIYEEIEIEDDDEAISENNFYLKWENHKRLLLTQDEQQRLLNDDARSQAAYHQPAGHPQQHNRRAGLMGKISQRRCHQAHSHHRSKKPIHSRDKDVKHLDPIEEKDEKGQPIDENE